MASILKKKLRKTGDSSNPSTTTTNSNNNGKSASSSRSSGKISTNSTDGTHTPAIVVVNATEQQKAQNSLENSVPILPANNHKSHTKEEPPKRDPLNRLKNTPKDVIPISKAPRRQRSSRFHVTEKVELEKLPNFN
ncbi:8436_t:CDS:2, partial [Entrophospora sp. SA101]